MDYEAWKFWITVGQTFATGVLTIWLWAVNRRTVRRAELDHKMAQLDRRVTIVEQDVRHGPSHGDIKELGQRLEELHGDLKEMHGGLTGIRRAVDLMNQHLLDRSGK